MILLLIIISSTTFLTSIGTIYFAFYRKPNQLTELNKEIKEATNSKQLLLQTVDTLSKDKSQLQTDYTKLKSETDNLKGEWNKLSSSISTGQQQLQTMKSDIEKLKTTLDSNVKKAEQTGIDLNLLNNKKLKLQENIGNFQQQFSKLDKEVNSLLDERKSLQTENSNLAEQVKKLGLKKKLLLAD